MMAKNIETYLNELKEISDQLSGEDIKLEEAMALYKKGSELAGQAEKMLAQYQKEIEIIECEERERETDV